MAIHTAGRPGFVSRKISLERRAAVGVDGNTVTRWSSQFSDSQWIQIDLGFKYDISRVKLNWENAYGKAYQIEVSSDGVNWTTIYSTSAGRYQQEPDSLTAYVQIANCYDHMQKPAEALSTLAQAQLILKQLPDTVFSGLPSAMSRDDWQRWLNWAMKIHN